MTKQGEEIERIREQLRERVRRGDNSGYEELYRRANGDASKVPWADLTPDPNLTTWLDRELRSRGGAGRSALVVGCGLGDDAEELARRGFDVTAFDISPSAIEWCRRRFAQSHVNFVQADVLAPPPEWVQAYDFVLESYTIQALSLDYRHRAIRQVARFVAPGGRLLIICRGRDESDPAGNLPYPLTRAELDLVREIGLEPESFEDFLDPADDPPVRRFRAVYRRP